MDLSKVSEQIEKELETTKSPIVAWSGGKDSQLLLYLVRQIRPDIPVLIFLDFFPKEHKTWIGKVIKDLNLVAFFYKPTMLKYERSSILTFYPFFAGSIPVVSDVIHTDECGLDKGRRVLNRAPLASFLWDRVFLGSRKSDSHPLVPRLDFSGFNGVSCPLWDWSTEEVWEAINYLEIPTSDTSTDAHQCMSCLEPEGRTVYCPKLRRNVPSIGTP